MQVRISGSQVSRTYRHRRRNRRRPRKDQHNSRLAVIQCLTQMRFVFGLVSYYRRFIEEFGKIATPLTKMLENNRPFVWEDDAKTAFAERRTRIAKAPILI